MYGLTQTLSRKPSGGQSLKVSENIQKNNKYIQKRLTNSALQKMQNSKIIFHISMVEKYVKNVKIILLKFEVYLNLFIF